LKNLKKVEYISSPFLPGRSLSARPSQQAASEVEKPWGMKSENKKALKIQGFFIYLKNHLTF
jgi:hypothetical protein